MTIVAMACVSQFTLQGDIRHKYNSLDPAMRAGLGGLASNEHDTGFPGVRVSNFQFGSIYSSPSNGSHVISYGIWEKYNSLDPAIKVSLGMLTSDEETVIQVPGGRFNSFQFGGIYWSAATGAHVMYHGIWAKYNSLPLPARGWLGMPISDEQGPPTNRENVFQGGSISWTPSGGAVLHLNNTPARSQPLPVVRPVPTPVRGTTTKDQPPPPIYFWLRIDYKDGHSEWRKAATYNDAMYNRSVYLMDDKIEGVLGPIYSSTQP